MTWGCQVGCGTDNSWAFFITDNRETKRTDLDKTQLEFSQNLPDNAKGVHEKHLQREFHVCTFLRFRQSCH